MASSPLFSRVKVATATTGTGTITLGAAQTSFLTFAGGGVANGNQVSYLIEDGTSWEIGTGTYTTSGTTLSRTVILSSNSNAAITLSGSAVVSLTALPTDIVTFDAAQTLTSKTLTSPTINTATISGGTINNASVGATTTSTGAFTTLAASSTVSGAGFTTYLASPPAIGGTAAAAGTFTTLGGTTITASVAFSGPINGTVGATTASTGAFTTLAASSTVSGAGFTAYLASPPAIGGTAAAAGSFTTLSATTSATAKSFRNTPTNAAGTVTTTLAIDVSAGDIVTATLGGNPTISFTNVPASGTTVALTVFLTQDATGSRTLTWPTAVVCDGGARSTNLKPIATASTVTAYSLITIDGGTTWYASRLNSSAYANT
jgi:hypothetical protein